MADPKIQIKRSSVPGKIPLTTQLSPGEFAINTYDGKVYIEQDQGGVGVGTTVIVVNPWSVGLGSTSYDTYFTSGNVGIGTTNPTSKLTVVGDVSISGIITASNFSGNASSATYATTAGISTTSQGITGTPNITVTNINASGISTLGNVQISSGIVTATSGIVTYYGDASGLTKESKEIGLACSDETTALTVGVGKVTFRMPYSMTLTNVRLNVTTAPTGSALVVNIKESGVSIFNTKPQIDSGSKTSVGSTISAIFSDTLLADNAEISVDIDQIGVTTAGTGLKVWLIGRRA